MNKFKAYYLVLFISLFSFLKTEDNDYNFFYNLTQGANLLSFPLITENNEIEIFFDNDNPDLISNFNIPASLISIISEGEMSLCQSGFGGEYVCVGSLDEISTNKGWIFLHFEIASGHLVWNLHPFGGLIGLGTSPFKIILFFLIFGSGIGIADNKAFE